MYKAVPIGTSVSPARTAGAILTGSRSAILPKQKQTLGSDGKMPCDECGKRVKPKHPQVGAVICNTCLDTHATASSVVAPVVKRVPVQGRFDGVDLKPRPTTHLLASDGGASCVRMQAHDYLLPLTDFNATEAKRCRDCVTIAAHAVIVEPLVRVTDGSELDETSLDSAFDDPQPESNHLIELYETLRDNRHEILDRVNTPITDYPYPCPKCETPDQFIKRNVGTPTEVIVCRACGIFIHPGYFSGRDMRDVQDWLKIITTPREERPVIRTLQENDEDDLFRMFEYEGIDWLLIKLAEFCDDRANVLELQGKEDESGTYRRDAHALRGLEIENI